MLGLWFPLDRVGEVEDGHIEELWGSSVPFLDMDSRYMGFKDYSLICV